MSNISIQAGNDVAQTTGASNVASAKDKYLVAMKNHSLMGQGMCTMGDMMLLFTELANAKFQQMSNKMAVSRDAQNMANKVEIAIAKIAKDGDQADLPPDVLQYMRDNNILVDGKIIDEFIGINQDDIKFLEAKLDYFEGKSGTHWTHYYQDIVKDLDEKGITIDGMKASEFLEANSFEDTGKSISQDTGKKLLEAMKTPPTVSLPKTSLLSIQKALEHTSGTASDFVQQSQLKLQQLMQNFNTAVTMANSIQSMNGESTKSIAQSIR
jgi:hypothetical protein